MKYISNWSYFKESIEIKNLLLKLLIENGFKVYSSEFKRLSVIVEVTDSSTMVYSESTGGEGQSNYELVGVKNMINKWIESFNESIEQEKQIIVNFLIEKGFQKICDVYRYNDVRVSIKGDMVIIRYDDGKVYNIDVDKIEEIKKFISMTDMGFND